MRSRWLFAAEPLHVLPVRVYYEDTDAAGIVYYANYLKFAERARTEMLRSAGLDHPQLWAGDGIGFVVRQCLIDYLAPARLDDRLMVHTWIEAVAGASLAMAQVVRRDDEEADLARMRLKLACVDRDGRAARLPPRVRAAFSDRETTGSKA